VLFRGGSERALTYWRVFIAVAAWAGRLLLGRRVASSAQLLSWGLCESACWQVVGRAKYLPFFVDDARKRLDPPLCSRGHRMTPYHASYETCMMCR
jgi:hypothetical protein